MKKLLASLLAVTCLSHVAPSFTTQAEAAPLKLRLASVTTATDQLGMGLQKFKELVEQKSGGSIKVQIFFNAALGGERVALEACQKGTIDIAIASQSNMSLFCSDFLVFDLPHYIPPTDANRAKLYTALDSGELGAYLRNKLNSVGLQPLFYPETGCRQHLLRNKRVTKVEELKGLKMRITDSIVERELCEALGIYPVAMSFGEVLTAMRQGAIDAMGLPLASFATMNQDAEIAKYALITDYNYYMSPVVMNLRKFNKLTPEQQKIILEASQEAVAYEREELNRQESEAREFLTKEGMEIITLSPEELAKFNELVRPIWEMFPDKISPETFAQVQKALQ